jgi:inner membrane protein
MDLLSHALVGGLMASAGLQKKYGLAATATIVAANVIPDLDGALMVLGPKYFFRYHRHPLTHSVGGAMLLSVALTAFVCLATPLKRPWLVFGISLSGMMMHLLSDLLTPWPIPFFWPLSARTYSLDLIHFFDPFLLFVLGAGCFFINRWPQRSAALVALTAMVVTCYLGFRVLHRVRATSIVAELHPSAIAIALPHRLSPTVWDVVVKGESSYTHYKVNTLRGEILEIQAFVSSNDSRATAVSQESDLVNSFLHRARLPIVLVSEEGGNTIVEWRDLHLMIGGGSVRGVKVVLDEEGRVIDERLELNMKTR